MNEVYYIYYSAVRSAPNLEFLSFNKLCRQH